MINVYDKQPPEQPRLWNRHALGLMINVYDKQLPEQPGLQNKDKLDVRKIEQDMLPQG